MVLDFEGDPLFITDGCKVEEDAIVRVPDYTSESQPAIILFDR